MDKVGILLREEGKYVDGETVFQRAIDACSYRFEDYKAKVKAEQMAMRFRQKGDMRNCERYKRLAKQLAQRVENKEADQFVEGFHIPVHVLFAVFGCLLM